jgi:hypothetical protein
LVWYKAFSKLYDKFIEAKGNIPNQLLAVYDMLEDKHRFGTATVSESAFDSLNLLIKDRQQK